MLAQVIFDLVNTITNDSGNVTYPVAELVLAINDAQRLVCIYRPDAYSDTVNISLAAGSKQEIASTARRLLKVNRNMGADGSTPGRYINQTSVKELNLYEPDWHTETDAEVMCYIYDESRPEEFFIYPNVAPTFYVEAMVALLPVDVTAGSSSISVADVYASCLVSWVCYRLFSRDGTESPNHARGESHKQTVFDILGIKSQADKAVSPNNE